MARNDFKVGRWDFEIEFVKRLDDTVAEDLHNISEPYYHFEVLKPKDEAERDDVVEFYERRNDIFYDFGNRIMEILHFVRCTKTELIESVEVKYDEFEAREIMMKAAKWYLTYGEEEEAYKKSEKIRYQRKNPVYYPGMPDWLGMEMAMINEVHMNTYPTKIDELKVTFDDPDCGFVDMHVNVNGEDKAVISISSMNNTFEQLKAWIEEIVEMAGTQMESRLDIETGVHGMSLYFNPVPYMFEEEVYNEDVDKTFETENEYYAMLCVYDGSKRKVIAQPTCRIHEIVRALYKGLNDFMERMMKCPKAKEFVDEWVRPFAVKETYNDLDDMVKTMYSMFVSVDVEEYLDNGKDVMEHDA